MPGAAPHTASPDANSTRAIASGKTGPRRSLQPPAATIPTTPLARGAAKESAYSATPSSSAATVGITVVTAVASKATNAHRANMPTVVAAYVGDISRGGACWGTEV